MNLKEITKAVSMISYVGISMFVPIFCCILIGRFIDKTFDTGVLFLVIFTVLGVGAAFRTLYMITVRKFKDDDYKDIKKNK